MKTILCFSFILAFTPLLAQEEKEPQTTTTQQKEERENARAVSLQDLREAEERINQERERWVKQKRRVEMLIEDMRNQADTISKTEEEIRAALNTLDDDQLTYDIPQEQIDHWSSRNPITAAPDFMILYRESPKTAISLIFRMKKKKSARLLDEVAETGADGKRIAAEIHEAIGEKRLEDE